MKNNLYYRKTLLALENAQFQQVEFRKTNFLLTNTQTRKFATNNVSKNF